jgi:hypothetical protein
MSLAGLANNYVLRTSAKRSPVKQHRTPHRTLGPSQGTPAIANRLPNVPQGYTNQLIRWIPAETLSIYAALGALIGSARR